MTTLQGLLTVALFGACLGSFFNVVVWRVPRGMSVAHPPSHCPHCGTRIPFWRNVPILTWTLQRGRAACCGVRISARYVVLEAFATLLSLGWALAANAGLWHGDAQAALTWYVFAMLSIPVALIDWEFFIIPDGLNLTGFVLGTALSTFLAPDPVQGALDAVRGAMVCAGGLYLFAWLFRYLMARWGSMSRRVVEHSWVRKGFGWMGPRAYRDALRSFLRWGTFNDDTEVLGLGDVNLMIAAGALRGPKAVLAGIPVAAGLGLLGYLVRAFLPGSVDTARAAGVDDRAVPFGPFLCVGFLIAQPLLVPYISAFLLEH